MASLNGFNAAEVKPDEGRTVPAGDYDAVIVKSEQVATKDGTGKYLKLQLQILSGQCQNRIVFHNLNLWLAETDDNKKQAVQIARGQLSSICRAVGVLTPGDSSELHNKPMRITVTVRPAKGEYSAQNNITAFKSRHVGPAAIAPGTAPAGETYVAPPALAEAPWGNAT